MAVFCVLSLSACEGNRVWQSHNKPWLQYTKKDQTICARWALISLTEETCMWCQLWDSTHSVLHSTFDWGVNFLFCTGGFWASGKECWHKILQIQIKMLNTITATNSNHYLLFLHFDERPRLTWADKQGVNMGRMLYRLEMFVYIKQLQNFVHL